MPTYTYKREDGTRFEYVQSMKDEPLTECPETGQPVKRVFASGKSGSAAVHFRGGGWTPKG